MKQPPPMLTVQEIFARTGPEVVYLAAIQPDSKLLKRSESFPMAFHRWWACVFPETPIKVELVQSPTDAKQIDGTPPDFLPPTSYYLGFESSKQADTFVYDWNRAPWRDLYGNDEELVLVTVAQD